MQLFHLLLSGQLGRLESLEACFLVAGVMARKGRFTDMPAGHHSS